MLQGFLINKPLLLSATATRTQTLLNIHVKITQGPLPPHLRQAEEHNVTLRRQLGQVWVDNFASVLGVACQTTPGVARNALLCCLIIPQTLPSRLTQTKFPEP